MKAHDVIDAELASWIRQQPVFFVATAPLSASGHINASPKGGDSLRVLTETEVVYQDLTGSGAETAAHLNENGRIVLMFCAFAGPPRILRLHGRGSVIRPEHSRFAELSSHFPPHPGTRAYILVKVTRVSTSCGHGVPLMDYREPRHLIETWCASKGPEWLKSYRAAKNRTSIDGLPAFGERS